MPFAASPFNVPPFLAQGCSPVSVIKVGIVGVGKIARDQHIPSIAANPDFELVAVASLSAAIQAYGRERPAVDRP